jgi:hypothetical protein
MNLKASRFYLRIIICISTLVAVCREVIPANYWDRPDFSSLWLATFHQRLLQTIFFSHHSRNTTGWTPPLSPSSPLQALYPILISDFSV